MENLQGKIRRMITFIMLFVTVLCGTVWGQAVNGKITLKIESKQLSAAEAQQAITQNKPILLTVSMILEGEWVTMLDNNTAVKIGASSFSYAIATKAGSARADAPFNTTPTAWMLSGVSGCKTSDGRSLVISEVFPGGSYPQYYADPNWNRLACPTYGYGLGFSNPTISMTNAFYAPYRHVKYDESGKKYYEVDLFPIAFYLKSLGTVYVRGVDAAGTIQTDPDDAATRANGASPGTTEINMYNGDNVAFTKADGTGGDWTYGTSQCYGGIIPGGIFIEQAPEAAQFEPSITFSFIEKKR